MPLVNLINRTTTEPLTAVTRGRADWVVGIIRMRDTANPDMSHRSTVRYSNRKPASNNTNFIFAGLQLLKSIRHLFAFKSYFHFRFPLPVSWPTLWLPDVGLCRTMSAVSYSSRALSKIWRQPIESRRYVFQLKSYVYTLVWHPPS